MGLLTFKGGIHPDDGKRFSKDQAIRTVMPKGDLVYPLSQHIGAPANPVVKKGDHVLKGQVIAEAGGFVSAPVHASVSGTVKGLEQRFNPAGSKVECIVIENDGEYKETEYAPVKPLEEMSREEILERIGSAGIVGMGGAGFPTKVKLSPKEPGRIEYIIANCAECEPYITADYRRMLENIEELVSGMRAVLSLFPNAKGYFAVEDNKKDCAEKIRAAIADEPRMDVKLLMTKYPQGAERQLIYAVTNRMINSTMLPADAGCIVDNVETLIGIHTAVIEGRPLMERVVTVSGDAVASPGNFKVLIGTDHQELIEEAGGFTEQPQKLISGGPMMGKVFTKEEAANLFVSKTMSGLIVLPKNSLLGQKKAANIQSMINRAKSACIQCSYCTQMCPRHLLGHPIEPHKIMRKLSMSSGIEDILEDKDIRNAAICCECGVCEVFACPMGLLPRAVNSIIKKELAMKGFRYTAAKQNWMVSPERFYRKTPSKRIVNRVGVGKYGDFQIDELIELRNTEVSAVQIALKQNIGAAAVPVVSTGDLLKEGQMIAECPKGNLGVPLHASVSGKAVVGDTYIRIEKV